MTINNTIAFWKKEAARPGRTSRRTSWSLTHTGTVPS
jgi:hypothetical protein